MTESTIYWITRLDEIREFLVGVQIIPAIVAGVSIIMSLIGYICMNMEKAWYGDGYDKDDDYKVRKSLFRACRTIGIIAAVIATMCSLTCTFLPTTKEMVAIKVVPAIVSSEQASRLKDIGDNAIDVAAEWLKSQKKAKEVENDGSK